MGRKKSSSPEVVEGQVHEEFSAATLKHVEVHYSGPLPDPQTFSVYERITPGAGDRILKMAENEQAHRHKVEMLLAEATARDTAEERREIRRSQWLAWFVAILIICIGAWLIHNGNPISGSLITGGTLLGIVSAFLRQNRRISEKHKEDKAPPKAPPKTKKQ